MRIVGFTGTRRGLTAAQRDSLRRELGNVTRFHHGDCVGADAEAHAIASALGAWRVSHPAAHAQRAFTENDEERDPRPPLDRNHDIVDDSDELIACPGAYLEECRSGTWATVRYLRRSAPEKRLTIIWPNGSLKREGPPR